MRHITLRPDFGDTPAFCATAPPLLYVGASYPSIVALAYSLPLLSARLVANLHCALSSTFTHPSPTLSPPSPTTHPPLTHNSDDSSGFFGAVNLLGPRDANQNPANKRW